MKTYYSSSLWCKDKGLPGTAQKLNWQFAYAGSNRCIPVIYRFAKGIVFDVITSLDEARLRAFFGKYGSVEEKLTPLERRCAEQEHPYQDVHFKEIWINGKRVENGYSSSSGISIPWVRQDDELKLVRKAYSALLKETACFACARFCVPYPETDSKMEKLRRFFRLERVKSLKLSTFPVQWFFPLDIYFEISPQEKERMICFKHPRTSTTHTLYFQNAELVEVPLGANGKRRIYVGQLMYEIEPALPAGDKLTFNSSFQYTEPPEDKFSPAAASSIGIIGGADGPTAVFVTANNKEEAIPRGLHGLPLHRCFSLPGFHQKDTMHFVLEGINTEIYKAKNLSQGIGSK
ncbi:MAG: hypothetical protein PHT78_14530 [Desulfitobacteriaceae bacterium]|nr:hypothetical protein [Desulfitobacteriaceae bacterium]MDD4754429.1 hypothetical protein [Desulfitobacteriaceae bacterium]